MRTLTSERFAPITSSPGFLELPLDDAADALSAWRRQLVGEVSTRSVSEPFPSMLGQLNPLTGGNRPREMLVRMDGNWTAYFDCSLRGTDAVSTIGHLTRTMRCQGVAIQSRPHIAGGAGRPARYGSVQFELFGPLPTEFLNYVRTVYAAFTGSKWEFGASGTPQAFEEFDRYSSRRARDRFTSDMLERYCVALGLKVFDESAYGPDAILVESVLPPAPGGHVMMLADVQAWLGIVPGEADTLPA